MAFEAVITSGELHYAIKRGKKNKAPGFEGICQEFLQTFWVKTKDELLQILSDMYGGLNINDQQKFRILICLPIRKNAASMDNYRPLTILNANFKLLTRIIANRLKP
jgi:hypothetical protein